MLDLGKAASARVRAFATPPPPVSALRSRGAHRRRVKVIATLTVLVTCGLTAALAVTLNANPRSTIIVGGAPSKSTPLSQAKLEATRLLDIIILPSGAQRVTSAPGANLTVPPFTLGCSPIIDRSQFWEVPGTISSLVGFLMHHIAPTFALSGTGGDGGSQLNYMSESPSDDLLGPDQVVVSFQALDHSLTGVRIDGIAVPSTAACVRHSAP